MVLGNPFEQPPRDATDRLPTGEGAALPLDRLASHVADLVLLLPIMALAMAPFRRAVSEAKLLDNVFDSDWALLQGLVAALAVGIAWDTLFISMWGTSPGRAIFGLRVVDVWTGEKPRPFHAFVRALTWWLSVFALGAPFFGVFGNARRRPLHDRVGDTEVRSRNTRRQSAPPKISELAFGSLFTTGAVFFASLVLTSQAVVLKEHAKLADKKDQPKLCPDVSVASDDWESREGKPPRIAVALGLSAAGSVESSCLDVEADYALWKGQGRLLGYLAKGLIHFGHDGDEADRYFAKVCELEPDSDSCRLAGWYRSQIESSEESRESGVDALEALARSLLPQPMRSPRNGTQIADWMRLLVLRELFVHEADPSIILQLTQDPARHEAIGAKLVEYRSRALWRLDLKREAKLTVFSSADALPRSQRVALTSWLCSRELYEQPASCSADALRACDMMERSADAEAGDYSEPSFVVASIRNHECRMSLGRTSGQALDELAKNTEDALALKLISSVRKLHGRDLSGQGKRSALAELKQIAATKNADDDIFVTEANIRLIEEMGRRPRGDVEATKELTKLRERWFASREARRYSDWGRALFAALLKREDWSKATEVGVLLSGEVQNDRALQGRVAVAAWKAGRSKLASELVDSLEKVRFPASLEVGDNGSATQSEVTRSPASDDEILERIRRSGRRK